MGKSSQNIDPVTNEHNHLEFLEKASNRLFKQRASSGCYGRQQPMKELSRGQGRERAISKEIKQRATSGCYGREQ